MLACLRACAFIRVFVLVCDICVHLTMAPSRLGRSRSNTLYLIMLTLLLSEDIELCPGPATDCGNNLNVSLKLFYQNATSIVSKLQDFNVYFSDHTYNFITITEIWLRDDISTTMYCQMHTEATGTVRLQQKTRHVTAVVLWLL